MSVEAEKEGGGQGAPGYGQVPDFNVTTTQNTNI